MTAGPVRLCQCGKPAGHASVCRLGPDDGDQEIERVDRSWEETNARHREERFAKKKRGMDAERREHRAEMTGLELHRLAVERAGRLSTVQVGNVEPSRGGGTQVGPPRQQLLDDDPRWTEHWAVIESRLRRVHELLDEAEGLGPVAAKTLLGSEKDDLIIREGLGLSPLAVVEKLGRDIAGSPETVRRVRRARGRSMKDGSTLDEPGSSTTTAPGTVRRVVIDS